MATEIESDDEESVDSDGMCTDIGLEGEEDEDVVEELDLFLEEGTDNENGLGLCNLLGVLGVLGVVSDPIVTFSSLFPFPSNAFSPLSLAFASLACEAEDIGSEKYLVISLVSYDRTGSLLTVWPNNKI